MDITTIVFNGFLGGLAALLLIFTCDLLATWMKARSKYVQLQRKEKNETRYFRGGYQPKWSRSVYRVR